MSRLARLFLFIIAGSLVSSCSYTFYPNTCKYPQSHLLIRKTVISIDLDETSGLVAMDDSFLSMNDSGGEPALYEFDSEGIILKKYHIPSIRNMDWEALAEDALYYYIADVGNNFGDRDTLYIYKIPKRCDFNLPDTSTFERISIRFNEITSRNQQGWYSHDCEAMFVFKDSIYLFAKDWVSKNTRIYVLPVIAGHYDLKARKRYDVDALITGADIDPLRKEVVLVGYRNFYPVLIRYNFIDDPAIIECGGKARFFPLHSAQQVEGVSYDSKGRIYITAEKTAYKQALYRAY
ncbi:hypothetical protein ACFLT1_04950 [Bacteroidota bacterium]